MAELGPTKTSYPGLWGYGRIRGFPFSTDISSPFGPRTPFYTPQGWVGNFHTGIDLPAPKGTPILAPCDFVVTFSGNPVDGGLDPAGGHGMFGRLEDGSGIGFWHMEGLQLDLGHKVRRGDIIGQVGTTGLSTGDHLHFMRLKGPMLDGNSWYDQALFTDPMLEFVDVIQTGTVIEEPAQEVGEPKLIVDFINNSLLALANNPPTDFTAAIVELQRRVAYLRTLLYSDGR